MMLWTTPPLGGLLEEDRHDAEFGVERLLEIAHGQ
jgi:hypothetical protein